MNGNSRYPRGLSIHVRNPVPRWRIVFIVLTLALIIGSAGQTPLAQAAQAGATELSFYMEARKERLGSVCKGELVHISVLVKRRGVMNDLGDELMEVYHHVTGVEVKGLVLNPNIGQISPNNNTTIWAGSIYPGAADFIFTAENYGETTISFRGQVVTPGWFGTNWRGGAQNVTALVDVTVIPCKFKVTTIGEWHPSLEGNPVIMATSGDAEVKADEQGNFTGTATVNWIVNVGQIGDCVQEHTIGNSQVEWTGQMDGADQLTINGNYQPASGSVTVFCGETWTFPEQLTLAPLQASVASYGGISRQTQVLEGGGVAGTGTFPGTVTIIVIPDEDEATVFIPADQEADWDDFINFFGALLVLH